MADEPRKPSKRLTFDDAVKVWIMYWNGWFQNRIAAFFDVNPGRINEILKERRHAGSRDEALKRYRRAA